MKTASCASSTRVVPSTIQRSSTTSQLGSSSPPTSLGIIDTCAANATIIEINASPYRLDMDWRWWKHAKAKGVKTSIIPDAHRPEHFQFLHYGIKVAQKGWLEREDVINCLPLGEVEAALNVKRE